MKYLAYPRDEKEIRKRLFTHGREDPDIIHSVQNIIDEVRSKGSEAVLSFTRKFDGVKLMEDDLQIPEKKMREAWDQLDSEIQTAIETAAARIRRFHEPQKPESYELTEDDETSLQFRVSPLHSAGLYVPGGTAAYPSSLLMNAIPARIAGVKDIVIVTPPGKEGEDNQLIIGTAWYLGIKRIFRVGGAQAVAALAFGAGPIPKVDKVVGPGNAYVAAAKRLLYGTIDIDMIAGPSEILVIADASSSTPFVVADLLSQAEHDALAVPVLIHVGEMDREFFEKELERQIAKSPRKDFIRKSLEGQGTVVTVENRKQAVEIANLKAPEHLEVITKDPEELVPQLENAGAIFVGAYTPEPIGDYVAGPNHVLPTLGTARFFSPLSVTSFMKSTSILKFGKTGFRNLAGHAIRIAEEEGLNAHAEAVRIRLDNI